ncbi:Sigma factor SigB regulation protein RsbQ [Rhodobacteraceae bacterium THAF1]|uniref:alpha/beta fold hydrolase BchO n=1 Tax=Palleronia sp. THAF1 TaxID=2587842 RepID=UPI000F3DDEA3|nr:alpha/beta fold hydrolase BchO [Palleronia sp. THAF1]QFU10223.1 Sigma factor SigB regulation protein RsbQ [Palleronia sp. THAF1]VDC16872.1 Sigma factor SigB regulation protein RsbQ [Rhodobacteraceae bacterium THAF1]
MTPTLPADWPNRHVSRFVDSRPHRWHVQVMGDGPVILLLHGTGASVHSWRDIMPNLARDHTVVAVDLPGHGFTRLGSRRRSSLAAMAQDVWQLCDTMDVLPKAIIGHSAGAAIALDMIRGRDSAIQVVGLNAALGSFDGPAAWAFPALAKALAAAPFVPRILSSMASGQSGVARMLSATGSRIDPAGEAQYRYLVGMPDHVDGALEMMAQWSTDGLRHALADLSAPVTLLYGEGDQTVPPSVSKQAARQLPNASSRSLGSLGHLAHEEAPDAVAQALRVALAESTY